MYFSSFGLIVTYISTLSLAQDDANTIAIVSDYTGQYRPRVHFSPPKGFMNDPNGLHRDSNGTWHLYYQYNPTELIAGNQHWGHATSPDLYHWTNQPIAISPPNSSVQIFSGSAVLDPNNTSDFFSNTSTADGVVAIYTLNTPTKQVQEIAYSTDGGFTFTPYKGNPVLDVGSNQFRDPKVIRYGDHWVMVISYAAEWTIGIYTSPDLKHWTHASNISHVGLLGIQYECPNLVQVPIGSNSSSNSNADNEWVLTISNNPGAPLGGSITQYLPGSFNGTHFLPQDRAARFSNFAKDDYAGQFFYLPDSSEAVSIGWASNWQYTDVVPTAEEGWRSALTLPRRNYLQQIDGRGYELVQEIYDISPILSRRLNEEITDITNSSSNGTFDGSKALYFDANITLPSDSSSDLLSYASINFTFSSDSSGESVKGGYFFAGSTPYTIWLDRGGTKGFENPFFTDKFSASQVNTATRIQGVLDHSVFEIYVDGGGLVGTTVIYPHDPVTAFEIASGGLPEGAKVDLEVWELADTWN